MFKQIVRTAAVALAALTITTAATVQLNTQPAEAQVDYHSHGYYPNPNYGQTAYGTGYISIRSGYAIGRQAPSRGSREIASFYRGDAVYIYRRYYNNSEGYAWYLVESTIDGSYAWVRSDLISF